MSRATTTAARAAFERAFALLGVGVLKWSAGTCSLKRRDDRFELDTDLFAQDLEKRPSGHTPEHLALELADALGLPADESISAGNIVHALPLLRPRFLTPEVLAGPGRAMCRRQLGPDLIVGVSIGRRTHRNFVTTRLLEAWNLSFDEVVQTAIEELMRRFSADDIAPVEADPRAVGIAHHVEPAASTALGLEMVVPGIDDWPGTLIGLPAEDTLLLVPLDEQSDLTSLAAIIESTRLVAETRTDPLSERPCWLYQGTLRCLNVRMDRDGGTRRAVVETANPEAARLLRFLSGDEVDPEENDFGGDESGPFG